MKVKITLLACSFAALFCNSASAEQIVNCDGCTAQEMFSAGSAVVRRPAWNRPHPAVYVTNIPGNSILRLAYGNNVDQNFDWETDIFESWVINTPVDPTITQLISEINRELGPVNDFYLPSNSSMEARAAGSISSTDYPGSAYDVIANSSSDQKVTNWLNSGWTGARQSVTNIVNTVAPVKGFFGSELTWIINVHFPDGTVARYTWSVSEKDFRRIPKNSRDSNGNLIPETLEDVAKGGYQEYAFAGGGGGAKFLERLNQMGVSVSSGGGSGTSLKIACVDTGGAPVCELVIY